MQGLRTSCIYLCKYHGNFHTYARLLGFNNLPFTGYETLSGRGRGQLFSCIPPLLKTILQPPISPLNPRLLQVKYSSSVSCLRQVVAAEGVSALYRGAGVNIVRGVAGAGVLAGFDKLKQIYTARRHLCWRSRFFYQHVSDNIACIIEHVARCSLYWTVFSRNFRNRRK